MYFINSVSSIKGWVQNTKLFNKKQIVKFVVNYNYDKVVKFFQSVQFHFAIN